MDGKSGLSSQHRQKSAEKIAVETVLRPWFSGLAQGIQ